jgi:F0F1-type ATP synthase gamma subunit
MPFQKGESGNPAGRPRGARNRTTVLLENLFAEDAEAIARKAIELAKAGEIAALRMCLDRLVPARKDEPVVFDLQPLDTAADSVAAAARIVAAVADGDLTPSEAVDLAKVIDVYVGALATKGFEERLNKLESAANR